ncbi:hypothetical protein GJ700_12615 [Duganella sp. FT92W]|uniref:Uncharacterized protein n=1 Tax=Pseudoduganella rivuli TaxID=2666085 RepID=A0A7X2IMF8_9BURK|nr:hypothetical protein [Pseudoduganella rivuli]MRV72550.1 hypothetical protein [Pseudoduganella rivuli]
MKFITSLLCGAGIAAFSALSALAVPQYAWGCGWLGASLYFILIVNKR